MCYDAVSATRKLLKYAQHRSNDAGYIEWLQKRLEDLTSTSLPKHYYVSGFAHPKLLVFTNAEPQEPKAFLWGLIPYWTKDLKTALQLSNQTLNARIETLFEKPSFREPAKNKRCLVYLDAFYEHFHLSGKTFPFRIGMKSKSPLALAGIWDEWTNKENGDVYKTVAIVTTRANALMAKIHNNPKVEEPRMPGILTQEKQEAWLQPYKGEETKKELIALISPYEENEMEAWPVSRLKGKEAIGNIPKAEERVDYMELQMEGFNPTSD